MERCMTMDDRVGMTPASDNAMSNLLAQNWWAIALRGGFAILFGIIALLMPGAALLAFVLLFAAYMLVDGVLAIFAAFERHREPNGWDGSISEAFPTLTPAGLPS